MRSRDVAIPFFLWIAMAILFHLSGRNSVEQVMTVVEEQKSIRNFTAKVRNEVRRETRAVEVTLVNPTAEPEPPEQPPEVVPPKTKKKQAEKKDEPKPIEETKPKEQKPEEKLAEKKPEEKKLLEEGEPGVAKKKPPELVLPPKRSIAVRQHYKDPNQAENKEAEFLGEKNNKVEEQTQSKITSTDQDEEHPSPGQKHEGADKEPGNADESRVASSEGTEDQGSALPPEATPPKVQQVPTVKPVPLPPTEPLANGPRGLQAPPPTKSPQEEKPQLPEAPPIAAGDQGEPFFTPAPRTSVTPRRLPPPPQKNKYSYGMGLGSGPATPGGINLNLSYGQAQVVVGKEQLEKDRRADALRLRSKHRGSWAMVGLNRWKSAIENYVPHVKPGNQTALNTRAAPFALYLNSMHQRIHVIFADEFLTSLDQRPRNDPLNNYEMHTDLELIINQTDGTVITMGVVRTSGVTAFDINALEAVSKASPFGKPPAEIVSPDGNVYVHWEFYRNPDYACSTYFAHPIILKEAPALPKSPPPTRDPQHSQHGDFVPTSITRPGKLAPAETQQLSL
jgi:TonB family protein